MTSSDANEDIPRAADPSVAKDGDKKYMVFGRGAGGVYVTELNKDTYLLNSVPENKSTNASTSRFTKLAVYGGGNNTDFFSNATNKTENLIESPYLFKFSDYWYLFVTWGKSDDSNPLENAQEIRVGRASNPTGPFMDD